MVQGLIMITQCFVIKVPGARERYHDGRYPNEFPKIYPKLTSAKAAVRRHAYLKSAEIIPYNLVKVSAS